MDINDAISKVVEVMDFLIKVNATHGEYDDPPDMLIYCEVSVENLDGYCQIEETLESGQRLLNELLELRRPSDQDA